MRRRRPPATPNSRSPQPSRPREGRTPPRFTRDQLAARRKAMAFRVEADGERGAVRRVAQHFGVTPRAVQYACREHDVVAPGNMVAPSTLAVIAELQRGRTLTEVAEARGLTVQRVSAIRKRAVSQGLSFPA